MGCAGRLSLLMAGALVALASCSGATYSAETAPKIYNGGKVYFVSPEGSDKNSGLSAEKPLKHIKEALEKAQPGDTVILLPGVYREKVKTVRDGLPGKPITVIGAPEAVIVGNNKPGGRVIEVKNSYINLLHIKVNGKFLNCEKRECYHDKLIYVHGAPKKPLKGIKILAANLKNALGECLRLKYVTDSEVGWSSISHCGLRDYLFNRGKQNGEGIYVGTAPEQDKGHPDRTSRIYIHHNVIATYGAECVDVKENSTDVVIEDNVCLMSKQETSGGISIRGNANTIAGNIVFLNLGAGIRLGGDSEKTGILNRVYNNYLESNRKASLKIMREPQGRMCGNVTRDKKPVYPAEERFRRAFEPCDK